MRLSRIAIKNYRCLTDVDIPLDRYTAFIGPNGAGKSSILYALEWFFGGRGATSDDLSWECPDISFEVTVTFTDLSATATTLLGKFGRDGTATFTRRYDTLSNNATYWGRALSGPGFHEVLNHTGIGNVRTAYKALQDRMPELRELTGTFSMADIEASFDAWESDAQHRDRLEALEAVDARHVFAAGGPMSQLAQFVLIKGSTDLSIQLDASGGRASTLNILTEKLVTVAKQEALAGWKERHSSDIDELERLTEQSVESATTEHQAKMNTALKRYLPEAEVQLRSSSAKVTITNDAPITTKIRFANGEAQDIASQGHGTQRAMMMAMVQSLAETNRPRDNQGALLLIAAEEPEIYQHPVRARYFARALSQLAEREGSQVLVATHSPYFVRPEHIRSLRKVRLQGAASSITWTSAKSIAAKLGKTDHEIAKKMEKEIPGIFSEGLFAHSVVLVEGDTDKAILEEIADHLDQPFDAAGVTIFPVGSKTNFRFYYELLASLAIRTFVIFDGDFLAADSRYPNDHAKREAAQASHQLQTMDCLSLLNLVDSDGNPTAFAFGGPSWIGDAAVALHDCIETEVKTWASFCSEMQQLHANLDGKNAFAYRLAAQRAQPDEIPAFLTDMVDAIHRHARARN